MSEFDTKAIIEAAHQATPLPWRFFTVNDGEAAVDSIDPPIIPVLRSECRHLDARFIVMACNSIIALAESHDRLVAEVAALRASLGQAAGAEPVGCRCPGACSSLAVQERAGRLTEDRDRLREALKEVRSGLQFLLLQRTTFLPAAYTSVILESFAKIDEAIRLSEEVG